MMRGALLAAALVLVLSRHALADAASAVDQAVQMRDREGATSRDAARAARLLMEASGLRLREWRAAEQGALTDPVPGFPDYEFVQPLHAPALRELAKSYQLGAGVAADQRLSLELYRRAAELGDAEAQGKMGMRYALGLHNTSSFEGAAIKRFGQPDEPAALLHYYFAAQGGDPFAQLALGYRHLYGLGVPQSCWSAVGYYQPAARGAIEAALAPGGGLPHLERLRLHVVAGAGGLKSDRQREVVAYYQYSADHGNMDAASAVGQVLNYGTHGVAKDHAAASHYLRRAAAAGDGDAAAHLGHMAASGLGTSGGAPDYAAALEWFRQAAGKGSPPGLYGLGYLYLSGRGVRANPEKAFQYMSQAAEGGLPDAHFFLGVMHLNGLGVRRKSASRAFQYFASAARAGHGQAAYNAAMMHLAGRGTPRGCAPAAELLKTLAERGPWAAALQRGHEAFFRGAHGVALLSYLGAAEMGMELGASNAGWMLERGAGQQGGSGAAEALAYELARRSAGQGNVASLLLLGDAHWYGRGVAADWRRAAAIYYEAYQERSGEAMFNLGWLHEHGAGVPRDLLLARRFYDMAAGAQPDAAVAVALAKAWLRVHEIWEDSRSLLPPPFAQKLAWPFELSPPTGDGSLPTGPLARLMPRALSLHWESLAWRLASWFGRGPSSPRGGGAAPPAGVGGDVGGSEHDTGGSIGDEEGLMGGEGNFGETALLLGLLGVLWLVVTIRRQRAQALAARVTAELQAGEPAAQAMAVQLGMDVAAPGAGVPPLHGANGGGGAATGAAMAAAPSSSHGPGQPEPEDQQQQVQQTLRRRSSEGEADDFE